jgi:hypothetical protein
MGAWHVHEAQPTCCGYTVTVLAPPTAWMEATLGVCRNALRHARLLFPLCGQ